MTEPKLKQPLIARWREVMAELGVPAIDARRWRGSVDGLKVAATASTDDEARLRVKLSIALDDGPKGLIVVASEHAAIFPQPATGDTHFDGSVALSWSRKSGLGEVYACLDADTRGRLLAFVPRGLTIEDGWVSVPHHLTATAQTTDELARFVRGALAIGTALSKDSSSTWQSRFCAIALADTLEEVRLRYTAGIGQSQLKQLVAVTRLTRSLAGSELPLQALRQALESDEVRDATKAHLVAIACREFPTRTRAICRDLADAVVVPLVKSELTDSSATREGAYRALACHGPLPPAVLKQAAAGKKRATFASRLEVIAKLAQSDLGAKIAIGPALESIAMKLYGNLVVHEDTTSGDRDRYALLVASVLCRSASEAAQSALIGFDDDPAAALVFELEMDFATATELIQKRIGVTRATRLLSLWEPTTHRRASVPIVARALVRALDVANGDAAARLAVIGAVAKATAWSGDLESWLCSHLDHDIAVREAAINALGKIGTLASVAPLVSLTQGFFRAGSTKGLAERAIKAIQERSARGAAGGLSVSAVTRGDLSLSGEDG